MEVLSNEEKKATVLNNMSTALVVFCVVVVTIAIIILIGVVGLILMVKTISLLILNILQINNEMKVSFFVKLIGKFVFSKLSDRNEGIEEDCDVVEL